MFQDGKLKDALKRLSELLEEAGESRSLLVVGGAAIELLGFDRVDQTRDVDVISNIDELLAKLASQVAKELGLRDSWLNSHASIFANKLSIDPVVETIQVFKTKSLEINSVTIETLIELKVRAYVDRGFDDNDIFLLKPTKEQLLNLKEIITREGNHNRHDLELDFHNLFEKLGYEYE